MGSAVATPSRPSRSRVSLAPLRFRGYRLLFAGQTTSVAGDAFHTVALPWLVYRLGGDARELGLVVAAYGLGRVSAAPFGGMASDRWGPRRVMMVSDLGRMLLAAALAVVAASGGAGVPVIALLTAGLGLGAGLFQPASFAITPRLLPAEHLQAGNALSSTAIFAAGLAGPGLAGLVVAVFEPSVALAVDAATFAVSAACLAAMGSPPCPPAGDPGPAAAAPARTLLQLLRESPLLRCVLIVTAAANLTVGGAIRVGLPSLASGDLAVGATGFGALLAAYSGGCLVGGLVAAGLTGLRRRGATAMLSGVVMAVAVALVPLVGFTGAVAALVVAGGASTVTNVLVITVVQQDTPPALLGRVMGAIVFAGLGLFPLSVAATGLVVARFGTERLFLVTGAVLLAAFAYGLSRPAMRRR